MTDARFEDAPFSDQPLKLRAETGDDLPVISALCQDAVLKISEVHWMPRSRRLVLVLHRFRWEDREAADRQGRAYERVQSALTIGEARSMQARGIDQSQPEAVLSLLAVTFEAEEDGAGRLVLTFANGGEIAARVETLDVLLSDLTKPWGAQTRKAPHHPD